MAEQIPDQPAIVPRRLGALGVGHSRGVNDGLVIAHHVNKLDEAVVVEVDGGFRDHVKKLRYVGADACGKGRAFGERPNS